MADDRYGDVVGKSSSKNTQTEGTAAKATGGPDTDLLKSIDDTLEDILTSMNRMSQSAGRSALPGDKQAASKWKTNRSRNKKGYDSVGNFDSIIEKFTDSIEKEIMDSIVGSDFKSKMQQSISGLADELGVQVSELPETLGKELGSQLVNSGIGKSVTGKLKNYTDKAMAGISDAFKKGQSATSYKDAIKQGWQSGRSSMRTPKDMSASAPDAKDMQETVSKAKDVSDAMKNSSKAGNVVDFPGNSKADVVGDVISKAGGEAMTAGAGTAGTAATAASSLSGLASAAAAAAPPILMAVAALLIIDKALESFAPAIEGIANLFGAFGKAAKKDQELSKKYVELAKERMEADYNLMVEQPFKLLEEAATNLYDAWDNHIKTISATQGYNKEDVQTLMSSYAQRLRDEGLTGVVSGSDIVDNLSSVLESGLSGEVAEEFAYLATKLNAAVPTQDFFSYASTYASIAANAIKDGQSQSEAIAYANAEMETFASNVLYASRQLSGGFSTGLKDAQQLFDYSVQIANASKEGNAAMISGVLTSVSAVTGAIAPDLASGIVDAVVKAATGGNSSEIVALRSLAGINASNTEFLKALAKDPQGVFTALFTNLAKMQNMSNDNFMEVAEGLSSVFGISMDAFARVDFNYLANAISQMNVNNASLSENMELLVSGQTTTTAEQMRMAQINQYMLEEGLAYVLDNEVARQVQQHMWDEQLAREMQESTYAVEVQGSLLEAIEGIWKTVENIVNLVNPLGWMKGVKNLFETDKQGAALEADFTQFLELGKVGSGNSKALYQLTTTNKDLNLVSDLVTLMGGTSKYSTANVNGIGIADFTSGSSFAYSILDTLNQVSTYAPKNKPQSRYTWANVGKSTANLLSSLPMNSTGIDLTTTSQTSVSSQSAIDEAAKQKFQQFIDSIADVTSWDAIEKGTNLTYDEWLKTANKFGVQDYKASLEQFGYTESDLKAQFEAGEAAAGSQYAKVREEMEDKFWEQTTLFATNGQEKWLQWEALITDNQTSMIAQLVDANTKLDSIHSKEKEFLDAWTSYYIDHAAYSENTMSAYKAADIIQSEKKENGDAVLALANALTDNTIGITQGFKDPVVQTNVLLAKILIVAEAIMQQNNTTGGLSLPDSLAALSLGITTQSS